MSKSFKYSTKLDSICTKMLDNPIISKIEWSKHSSDAVTITVVLRKGVFDQLSTSQEICANISLNTLNNLVLSDDYIDIAMSEIIDMVANYCIANKLVKDYEGFDTAVSNYNRMLRKKQSNPLVSNTLIIYSNGEEDVDCPHNIMLSLSSLEVFSE